MVSNEVYHVAILWSWLGPRNLIFKFWSQKSMVNTNIEIVGYHLPFQYNELFHLPYMAIAEISLGRSVRVRPEEPFLLLKYILTLSLILCFINNNVCLVNPLSCKYNYFPQISWFVLLLLLLVFTNQNTTEILTKSKESQFIWIKFINAITQKHFLIWNSKLTCAIKPPKMINLYDFKQ